MARKPSKDERLALAQLLYDSQLFGCHGVIVTNVCEGVKQLLLTLKRPDLIEVWEDQEGLAATLSGQTQPRDTEPASAGSR